MKQPWLEFWAASLYQPHLEGMPIGNIYQSKEQAMRVAMIRAIVVDECSLRSHFSPTSRECVQ